LSKFCSVPFTRYRRGSYADIVHKRRTLWAQKRPLLSVTGEIDDGVSERHFAEEPLVIERGDGAGATDTPAAKLCSLPVYRQEERIRLQSRW